MASQSNILTPAEQLEEYRRLIGDFAPEPENALPALQALSDEYGFVPDMAVETLSDHLHVPVAKLYALVTFYDTLSAETGDMRTRRYVKKTPPFDTVTPLRAAHPLERRLLLADIGAIDPEHIESYRAHSGYEGLQRALELGPEATIAEVTASKLRGKGGAGYPTGRKWAGAAAATGPRYVICNGNEGDPATCVDRFLLERNPHAVVEGLAIAAVATGAECGWLYIRDEYALARARVQHALDEAYEAGILGPSVMGSGPALELSVVRAGGTFACGESTALMNAIAGLVGEPRAHYTHTVEHGIYDCPTVLNNVETLAAVPLVLREGAEAFRAVGTHDSGTKLFDLTGDVKRPGIYEVPFGTTLRQLVCDIGGGPAAGDSLKALHLGGPCEGFVPPKLLDTPISFAAFKERGIQMGSGGVEALGHDRCIPATALSYVEFLCEQSCGKCTPCREGLRQMHALLAGICAGTGSTHDLDTLELLGETMSDASLCALGRSAASPVLSSLRSFRAEYLEHIEQRTCPAGACTFAEEGSAKDEGAPEKGGAA